jgi:hypothetical protein
MRRLGVIVALGALLGMLGGAVTASPALARGPGWQFVPIQSPFPEPAALCGFDIQGTQLVDKLFMKALTAPDGSAILLFTGAARISLTNPANGKTITANTSGPAKIIMNADGSSILLGKGIEPFALAPADQARFGLPGLFIFAGTLTATIAPDGITTSSLTLDGRILVNVCTALS